MNGEGLDPEIVLGGTTFPHPEFENDYERKSAQVMLTISARNIKDVDPDAGVDPYCVVSISDAVARQRNWIECGK